MKKIITLILPLVISSTVFAAESQVRCERELYGAALGSLMKVNLETKGIAIKLGDIVVDDTDSRTNFVNLEMTDSSAATRLDIYKVVLKSRSSCAVKSSQALID
jgi:hypothetical protein